MRQGPPASSRNCLRVIGQLRTPSFRSSLLGRSCEPVHESHQAQLEARSAACCLSCPSSPPSTIKPAPLVRGMAWRTQPATEKRAHVRARVIGFSTRYGAPPAASRTSRRAVRQSRQRRGNRSPRRSKEFHVCCGERVPLATVQTNPFHVSSVIPLSSSSVVGCRRIQAKLQRLVILAQLRASVGISIPAPSERLDRLRAIAAAVALARVLGNHVLDLLRDPVRARRETRPRPGVAVPRIARARRPPDIQGPATAMHGIDSLPRRNSAPAAGANRRARASCARAPTAPLLAPRLGHGASSARFQVQRPQQPEIDPHLARQIVAVRGTGGLERLQALTGQHVGPQRLQRRRVPTREPLEQLDGQAPRAQASAPAASPACPFPRPAPREPLKRRDGPAETCRPGCALQPIFCYTRLNALERLPSAPSIKSFAA